jgi:hypothetical protein
VREHLFFLTHMMLYAPQQLVYGLVRVRIRQAPALELVDQTYLTGRRFCRVLAQRGTGRRC